MKRAVFLTVLIAILGSGCLLHIGQKKGTGTNLPPDPATCFTSHHGGC